MFNQIYVTKAFQEATKGEPKAAGALPETGDFVEYQLIEGVRRYGSVIRCDTMEQSLGIVCLGNPLRLGTQETIPVGCVKRTFIYICGK